MVASPAGELIMVDVSLSAGEGEGSSMSGEVDATAASQTMAASVSLLAGNVPTLSRQAPKSDLADVSSSMPPAPGSTTAVSNDLAQSPVSRASGRESTVPNDRLPNHGPSPAPSADVSSPAIASQGTPAAMVSSTANAAAFDAPGVSLRGTATNPTPDYASLPNPERARDGVPTAATVLDAASSSDRATLTASGRAPMGLDGTVSQPTAGGLTSSLPQPYRGAEKIAGTPDRDASGSLSVSSGKQKNVLAASVESLTNRSAAFGINAAKPQARMPALAHPTPSVFAENDSMSFAAAPLTFDSLVQDAAETTAHSLTSSARRAVDSAMAVVDHFAHGTQRGVNLQFSISGVDVAVRVEMRPDGVHTTFRTDSPELCNALAQEWQSVVNTQPTDRSQRLADPVFTSTSAGGPASGEHGASQQRESGTPQSQWEKATAFAPPAVARARTDAPLTAAAAGPRHAPHGTARHLSVLA
ncbi:hypothetical protein [Opitutus terrae]|uniref:hypothetical protein n=1 Tax=Opitutus terrae TaxID=107709 RepID=UPI0011D05D93|nr:hypothetical protein [Opitutus terrae]